MKKEDIHLSDWNRILLGDTPGMFLVEVFIRSVLTYIVLLFVLKWLGKRMSGTLTHTEMAVMLMFGAIVASSMQIPDRGIVEGAFVLLLVLIFQRLLTWWTVSNKRVEDKALGFMQPMIKDGVMQLNELNKEAISRNQLLGQLRSKNITQLGQVKRMYMETNGAFSIYKYQQERPGLSVLPDEDKVRVIQACRDELKVCRICGALYPVKDNVTVCQVCKSSDWEKAVINKRQS